MFADFLIGMTGGEGSPSIYWLDQVGDAAKHSTMNKTAPTLKNYPVRNADNAEVEKPCMKDKKANKRQYLPSKCLLFSDGVGGGSRAWGVRAAEKGGNA